MQKLTYRLTIVAIVLVNVLELTDARNSRMVSYSEVGQKRR